MQWFLRKLHWLINENASKDDELVCTDGSVHLGDRPGWDSRLESRRRSSLIRVELTGTQPSTVLTSLRSLGGSS